MRQSHASPPASAFPRPRADEDVVSTGAVAAARATPPVKLLSNGRYHVMVSASGGGYSRHEQNALTRWREDATRDCWGTFVYVRDCDSGVAWSPARQPVVDAVVDRHTEFSASGATFVGVADGIEARVEVSVLAEADLEVRRVTIINRSRRPRVLDVTSYAEVVLAPAAADDAHPAFNKLFVQTAVDASAHAVLCHRRPGNGGAPVPWLFHAAMVDRRLESTLSYETDRARFIGRGRTLSDPAALHVGRLSGTQGSVLDAIVAIRAAPRLDPGQSATVDYVLGVGENRAACLAMLAKYRSRAALERAMDGALESRGNLLKRLKTDESHAALYDRLAACLIYGSAVLRAKPAVIMGNQQGQSGLWGFSVSGDYPIVFLQLGASPRLEWVRELVRAHAYWQSMGLATDLVLANAGGIEPRPALQRQVLDLVEAMGRSGQLDQRAGIFARLATHFAAQDRTLFQAVARVVLDDDSEDLAHRLRRIDAVGVPGVASNARPGATSFPDAASLPDVVSSSDATSPSHSAAPALILENGLGGFTPDGREYVVTLTPGSTTPAPWVNVLANPSFGTIVSESGCANSWSENAHEFRLTPWSNDPVCDSSGEAIYLRDEASGAYWSPTPWPRRGAGTYECRHGFGYSVFRHEWKGLESELTVYVARDRPVKFCALTVRNHSGRARRLSATGYVEWVLGDQRVKTMAQVTTRRDPGGRGIVARNAYSLEFGDRHAFFASDADPASITADRTEFLGVCGAAERPAAMSRAALSGTVGAALDPCAALRVPFDLAPNGERRIVFMLGAGESEAAALALLRKLEAPDAAAALGEVRDYWRRTLDVVRVETPDPALDVLVNGWLLYQVLACRVWARSAFYQPGGAFGFRDQLQDVMALVHTQPGLVRAHILLSASRQYPEGDAQHWWHPPHGRGVRTRCSDDYLWLALATCRYVGVTGDRGILDESIDFLSGRPLNPGEDSYYELPGVAHAPATLYDHCVRAIRHGLRFGKHGLPLMGTGDWNDGMNRVGAKGSGESVWMAFFLHDVLRQFRPLVQARGDDAFRAECDAAAARLVKAIDEHGWDGEWFVRAYFDDGTPLGSARNAECRMGSIAQSWSVLSGAAAPERAEQAMASLDRLLVDRANDVVKLLAPPFDNATPDPGYIRAYVPGVRENGGQYTHAAVWAAMAFAQLHDAPRAGELATMLNPVEHVRNRAAVEKYKVEPYVIASDVYALPPHTGRGGWTWYSGSAGWMYRLLLESVLGLRREAGKLYLRPCMPNGWNTFTIRYRYGATLYHIVVARGDSATLSVDGRGVQAVALADDGIEHRVRLALPPAPTGKR
ncbi:MAG: hypothetical protein EPN41_05580 [Candidimonas sp.]|nr:MAG: hypothetical protein EPN41_05580 [Candidimonas sp.]